MTAEMLGTLISSTVAFAGLAAFFLLANIAFKAMGLGPVFMRPEDDPARKKANADPDIPSARGQTTAAAASEDSVRQATASRLETPDKQSASPEMPNTVENVERLKTGLRRARFLTTVIVFGLSAVLAISYLKDETPSWAKACGWQLTGIIEIESAADRAAYLDRILDDLERDERERTEMRRQSFEMLTDEEIRAVAAAARNNQMADGSNYALTEDELREASERLKAKEDERRAYRQKAWDMTQPPPDQAAEALTLGNKFGVPRKAVEADPDYWRKRDLEAQRQLMETVSSRTMAWLDDGERSCWPVTQVRLQALGIAVLPALVFFLMTFVLIWLGRWVLVLDRPR